MNIKKRMEEYIPNSSLRNGSCRFMERRGLKRQGVGLDWDRERLLTL